MTPVLRSTADSILRRAPVPVAVTPEVVCAWCPDAAEKTAAATLRGAVVTHGICAACAERMEALL